MTATNRLQANIELATMGMVGIVLTVAVLNQPFQTIKNSPLAPAKQSPPLKGNVGAFLATIRYAEGTAGPAGYRTIFTGKQFSNFSQHPQQLQCTQYAGRKLCSDAAGAYQYLSTTWSELGQPDFTPASQDRGAIELLRRGGVLPLVEAGRFEEAVYKASSIWASLPNRYGRSAYGQPVKSIEKLKEVYKQNLR